MILTEYVKIECDKETQKLLIKELGLLLGKYYAKAAAAITKEEQEQTENMIIALDNVFFSEDNKECLTNIRR